jgi:hypothetical protein
MLIRPARFADIPAIVAIILEAYAHSIHAGTDVDVDVKVTKALLMQAIQRHGAKGAGGSSLFVAEHNGAIAGFIIGIVDRVQNIGTKLYATDLMFLCAPDAPPGAAGRLVTALVAWARSIPDVRMIYLGASDVVGDWARTEKLYRRKGFAQSGVTYRMEVNPCPAS